ncbi:ATP-dependent RNA helicase dbp6 [Tulasnella sp. 427]|nr:ATP-dependent RNA helicase dbp6 [Tulasnella sp. 427]
MGTKDARARAIFAKRRKEREQDAKSSLVLPLVHHEPLATVHFTGIVDDEEPLSVPTQESALPSAPEPSSDEERAKRKRIKREKRAARRTKDAFNNDQQAVGVKGSENESEGPVTHGESGESKKKGSKKKKKQGAEVETGSAHRPTPAEGGKKQSKSEGQITEGKDEEMADLSDGKRPKKRRKVAFTVEQPASEEGEGSGDDHGDDKHMEEEEPQSLEQGADEPISGFLPSFPRPRKPRAPSASVLYKQGLDKALARAEIVDSKTTLPLGPPESDDMEGAESDDFGLSSRMRRRLAELDITELFAVQTALLPFLLKEGTLLSISNPLYRPYDPPRDVCVSAPTGSGKTLAYAIPIVEMLSVKVVTRLRALIVLPTRELAAQVYDTLESVGRGRHLKMALVTGQHTFSHERAQLAAEMNESLRGGSSKIDILVCTPGRLIDHLNGTPNFTLQHLRFLVIDEADRLIAQSFQEWLPRVLSALEPPSLVNSDNLSSTRPWASFSTIHYSDAVAPAWSSVAGTTRSRTTTSLDEPKVSSCQKLLLSATLTQDPEKIAALHLRNPKYFIVKNLSKDGEENADEAMVEMEGTEQFALPQTLSEHWLSMDSSLKPLTLFYLVAFHGVSNALVFTKSTESTIRLVRLFELFETARHQTRSPDAMDTSDDAMPAHLVIRAFSSDLSASDRRSLLAQFTKGEVHILVCSDLMSRGIDIANVAHVVNYDVPLDMRRYVHRVGRTARAGRKGDAWTLAENQEVRHFKEMMKGQGRWKNLERVKPSSGKMQSLQPLYETALKALKEEFAS